MHSLVYSLSEYLLKDVLPLWAWIAITFVMAYAVAWGYSKILKRTIYWK